MACIPNITSNYSAPGDNVTSDAITWPRNVSAYELYERNVDAFFRSYVILPTCVLGIAGNLLNLVVLTRARLSRTMYRLEKSAHVGLLALAASDLLFCIAALPHSLDPDRSHRFELPRSVSFWLVYRTYYTVVLNALAMSSTWLVVALSVSRYLAICHPLHGRRVLGATYGHSAVAVVAVVSALANLPRIWVDEIVSVPCLDGGRGYFRMGGPLKQSPEREQLYNWLYFVLCVALPLVILSFCNFHLVRALHKSARLRQAHCARQQGHSDKATESKNIVTLTLVIIVVCYIVLFVPAEILNFIKYTVIRDQVHVPHDFNLAISVCNTLQTLNFAFNFVLYCVINVHFRATLKGLLGLGSTSLRRASSTLRGYGLRRLTLRTDVTDKAGNI